jgi:hypothetical protein
MARVEGPVLRFENLGLCWYMKNPSRPSLLLADTYTDFLSYLEVNYNPSNHKSKY